MLTYAYSCSIKAPHIGVCQRIWYNHRQFNLEFDPFSSRFNFTPGNFEQTWLISYLWWYIDGNKMESLKRLLLIALRKWTLTQISCWFTTNEYLQLSCKLNYCDANETVVNNSSLILIPGHFLLYGKLQCMYWTDSITLSCAICARVRNEIKCRGVAINLIWTSFFL